MSNFALDRDLLALEPSLFRDCGFLGQRLSKATASISGTTLTASSPDVDFVTAAVAAGHVALVGGVPCEVISVASGTQLSVSRLRDARSGAVLPPPPVTSQELIIATFAPQIALAHAQLLAMAGIDPSGLGPQAVADDAVVRLEATLSLAVVWAAAAALTGEGSAAWSRAEWYRGRAAADRGKVRVPIDTNSDGIADASRSLGLSFTFRGY